MYCVRCGTNMPDMKGNENYCICPVCGHTAYGQPSPCVSILIVSEGKVLLGLRGQSSIMPGKWCLPCGYIEKNENFVDAALREVYEETHLQVELKSIINVVSNHFSGDIHSLVVVFLAMPLTQDLQAGDDICRVAWFSPNDLPDMAFQADIHILKQYCRYGENFGIPISGTETVFVECPEKM